jgi:hypothetical protein
MQPMLVSVVISMWNEEKFIDNLVLQQPLKSTILGEQYENQHIWNGLRWSCQQSLFTS